MNLSTSRSTDSARRERCARRRWETGSDWGRFVADAVVVVVVVLEVEVVGGDCGGGWVGGWWVGTVG